MARTKATTRMRMFGAYLQERREAVGKSLGQVAREAGYAFPAAMCHLEAGPSTLPTPDRLARLAEALETPITDLLQAAGYDLDNGGKRVEGEPQHLVGATG